MHHPLGAFYSLLGSSLLPRLISFFGHRRKEPGEIGSFKPLISGGSDRVPPLKLQNRSMWMRDSLRCGEQNHIDKDKQGVIRLLKTPCISV